uniref:NAD-dependent epimerase/dehydratase domain-containing protein n=1 Tax=viral metagenome TaxID=1070528 RepID=A0A6C0B8Z0_9ZZZZ
MKVLITGGNGNIAKMIKLHLSCEETQITNVSHSQLDVLNESEIKNFLNDNEFDILVHTAIVGGRRTKKENGDITHTNLLMFENLLKFSHKFKMIINLDSAAIYDRDTDILNRKEEDLYKIPTDYYGFSKYLIYQRSLQNNNVFNFRIFNIFHTNEEDTRFIKSCFNAKKNNSETTIFEDKFFDFVYEDDFVKIVKYYFDNVNTQENLEKTINICYEEKFKLSDIAKIILGTEDYARIHVLNNNLQKNYCGDSSKLQKLNLQFIGLKESLKIYEDIYLGEKNQEKSITPSKNIIIFTHMGGTDLSGGTIVEYYLGKVLEELGQNVKIYTVDGFRPDNGIYANFYNNEFPIDDNCVVIYCEGTVGNPLNAKYVVRWLLSELGKNVPYDWVNTWGKDELVYYFNSETKFGVFPEKKDVVYKLLSPLYINPCISQHNFEERSGICYALRKSVWHRNPINWYSEINGVPIENAYLLPHSLTHSEFSEIFNKYKVFICYDPCTFLTIMAAICGCISVVYPWDGLTKLEWITKTGCVSNYLEAKGLDNLYGIAYGMDDLQYAINTLHLVQEQWHDIVKFNIKNTVVPFINDINNFEHMQNTIQNNFF